MRLFRAYIATIALINGGAAYAQCHMEQDNTQEPACQTTLRLVCPEKGGLPCHNDTYKLCTPIFKQVCEVTTLSATPTPTPTPTLSK